MPSLIGLVTLPFPKIITREGYHEHEGQQWKHKEIARRIAFDQEGNAWALIERMTMLGGGLGRISFARWQAVEAIPFLSSDPIKYFDDDPAVADPTAGRPPMVPL